MKFMTPYSRLIPATVNQTEKKCMLIPSQPTTISTANKKSVKPVVFIFCFRWVSISIQDNCAKPRPVKMPTQ